MVFFRLHFCCLLIYGKYLSLQNCCFLTAMKTKFSRWNRYFFVKFHTFYSWTLYVWLPIPCVLVIQKTEILAQFRFSSLVDRRSKLWQVCGKIPFDKNPSGQRMLKFHLTYTRPCINSDSAEKVPQKASQRGKKEKILSIMKGGGQAQLTFIPWSKSTNPHPVNTDTAQRGCHDKVQHKRSWLHHQKCGMFKMQPGRWTQKLHSPCGFLPDQKYLTRKESCNTPSAFDSRKMANLQV